MDENIRLARLQFRAKTKKPGFSFVSDISDIFSHMSSQDRASRKREKTRRDLVRIHFDTEPTSSEPAKNTLITQLGKILHLD